MSAHTPGLWEVEVYHDGCVIQTRRGRDWVEVGTAEREEDAALVAAAPELLAALEALVAFIPPLVRPEDYHPAITAAVDAIAKARGTP